MLVSFANKVAIVTGGASGIGAALSRILVEGGAKVVIADTDSVGGGALASELGPCAHFTRADLTDDAQVGGLATNAIDTFGRVDLLFNNAGKGLIGTVPTLDPADWRRIIDINLTSAFLVSRAIIPHLKAGGGGAIVNTCSVSGLFGDYGTVAYNVAKGGLVNLTRAMGLDHARDGIRVNAVCPGIIGDTAMTRRLQDAPGGIDLWNRRIPMARAGTAVEVARVMAFLGSDLSSYMTGAMVVVDGGITAHTGFPTPRDFADGAS